MLALGPSSGCGKNREQLAGNQAECFVCFFGVWIFLVGYFLIPKNRDYSSLVDFPKKPKQPNNVTLLFVLVSSSSSNNNMLEKKRQWGKEYDVSFLPQHLENGL